MRSTVDLPQPEGPTMVIISPTFGRSCTTKDTSLMAILAPGPVPKTLVTFWNRTSSGSDDGAPWDVWPPAD
jgi:hypothetical protein